MFKEEVIKAAEGIDIVDYCIANNIDLKSDSERYYRLIDHDSCVIDRKKNAFYWNSKGVGGNVINFVQTYKEVGFRDAMKELTAQQDQIKNTKDIEFINEPYIYNAQNEVSQLDRARSYLVNERKIDPSIIDDLHERGLIKQDKRNNVLFLWKDEERVMGCSEQGTIKSDKFKRGSWKSIQKNSTINYGFNVKYGKPKHLKFFESSIDALSYASLNKEKLEDTWLISMEGLKHNTVFNYSVKAKAELKDAPDSIALCVDHDKGGLNFIEKFKNIKINKNDGTQKSFEIELPQKEGHDWNKQLQDTVKHSQNKKQFLAKKMMKLER